MGCLSTSSLTSAETTGSIAGAGVGDPVKAAGFTSIVVSLVGSGAGTTGAETMASGAAIGGTACTVGAEVTLDTAFIVGPVVTAGTSATPGAANKACGDVTVGAETTIGALYTIVVTGGAAMAISFMHVILGQSLVALLHRVKTLLVRHVQFVLESLLLGVS